MLNDPEGGRIPLVNKFKNHYDSEGSRIHMDKYAQDITTPKVLEYFKQKKHSSERPRRRSNPCRKIGPTHNDPEGGRMF